MYGVFPRLVATDFYELSHPVAEKLTVKPSFMADCSVRKNVFKMPPSAWPVFLLVTVLVLHSSQASVMSGKWGPE